MIWRGPDRPAARGDHRSVHFRPCERDADHRRGGGQGTDAAAGRAPTRRRAGHPPGVALLYAAAPQALRYVRL